jgi:hypothetical protein
MTARGVVSVFRCLQDLAQLERCFGVAEGGFEELRHGMWICSASVIFHAEGMSDCALKVLAACHVRDRGATG